jgi:hypothetical protein
VSAAMQLAPGGAHSYTPGLRFAASAVVAAPGHTIERAVLPAPVDLPFGYDRVEAHLSAVGRPMSALCGLELRMPAALPLEGFTAFNDGYLARLDGWGLLVDSVPALARTNVCPRQGVEAPGLVAFSYTVERPGRAPSYVVSGVADLPAGGRFPDDIVRRGETTPDALREKAEVVVAEVASRIAELGAGVTWTDDASVHLYSLHDLTHLVATELLPGIGVRPTGGVVSHDTAPPTAGLELEIDVRTYDRELHLPA